MFLKILPTPARPPESSQGGNRLGQIQPFSRTERRREAPARRAKMVESGLTYCVPDLLRVGGSPGGSKELGSFVSSLISGTRVKCGENIKYKSNAGKTWQDIFYVARLFFQKSSSKKYFQNAPSSPPGGELRS
jgi:hypothetical protein